jgi:hypothetical protein
MHPAPPFPIGTPVDLGGERRRWFSYQDIENIALHHRREVMACRYDAIVGLARGGLYLATMLSQMTGIAHATAYYDRATGAAHLHNLPRTAPCACCWWKTWPARAARSNACARRSSSAAPTWTSWWSAGTT